MWKGRGMMDFTFHMPVRIISGEGCIRQSGRLLREFGKRCLIMTGMSSAKASGALDDVLETLEEAGVDATVFPEITANPLLSQCQTAAYTAEICRAEFIIGIGGGSVMDAAKAAAWLATNNCNDGERLMEGSLRRPPLPLVLVGITAGTGSEVSAVSVLTMDADKRKRSVFHQNLYAKLAFADPRYTFSIPRRQTVSTALDAFAHAVEGWFAPSCGDVITAFGEKAFPLIADGLDWLARHDGLPGPDMRTALYYGSLWAGMVLNATGTAYPHPLGYILTEEYDIPHGMACAVFLPGFLDRAERHMPERAERLYALCGGRDIVFGTLEKLVSYDVRMTREQIEGYLPRWEGVKNFERTPGGFAPEEAAALFRSLFLN
jgi:alcohol dehydrogenase class IV